MPARSVKSAFPADVSAMRRRPEVVAPASRGLTWSALSWQARLYVALVLAAGASTLAAFFPVTFPNPVLFVALTLFACLTSLWKVNLPISTANGSTLSVSYAANLMALLLLGPQRALLVAMAGVWTQCTYKVKTPYPLYRTWFSLAAEVLTMVATSIVYDRLGGPGVPLQASGLAKPLVGAIGAYFLVNTGLVAGAIALSSRRSFFTVWKKDFFWSAASFMVAGSAGAMAALVVDRGEHWKAILLIAPIYLTYRTYQLFVGRLEDHMRHVTQMRQVHEGTLKALALAREAERAEQIARAAAERANRVKDEFLAMVSHELRTPLNSIFGWADMLRRGRLEGTKRERAFQSIYDNAQRQAKLIDDLLDVSRVMSGTLSLERTAVDLNDVVDDAVQVVQPAADAKNVRIVAEANSWSGFIQGDSVRLQQIVSNLLSNAVKFTPGGGVVQVGVTRVSDSVVVKIRDNGQGISPDFLPHVFEAFRQADASTTRLHGGLGLGLSIVKHLVEAHGGSVEADSAGPGRGATFVARFPINPACAALSQHSPPSPPIPQSEPASLDGLHILVIDDDDESRLVVAEHLEGRGVVVLAAASADDGYNVLQRERVDALLVDIAMPVEDGYTFIRRIRAGLLPGSTRVPAAALTALTRKEDRQLALDAGFEMHIAKPVEPDALVTAVAALVRDKATSLAASPQARRS